MLGGSRLCAPLCDEVGGVVVMLAVDPDLAIDGVVAVACCTWSPAISCAGLAVVAASFLVRRKRGNRRSMIVVGMQEGWAWCWLW